MKAPIQNFIGKIFQEFKNNQKKGSKMPVNLLERRSLFKLTILLVLRNCKDDFIYKRNFFKSH